MLEALYLMGYPDEAMARIKDRYAPMVNDPDHSTLWEFFAGPEQDAAGTFNHAWTGGPLTMMSRYAAGIQQVKPGFAEFAVRPQLGSMKSIAAKVNSANGKIDVDIDAKDANVYKLDVTAPAGTVAQVHLPTVVLEDVKESGAPLTESSPGVLGVTVDDAAGETVVRVKRASTRSSWQRHRQMSPCRRSDRSAPARASRAASRSRTPASRRSTRSPRTSRFRGSRVR
ncbi:alpha-L-rhamnosidase C-terminal domain-containing protein [Aeromicrobium sp. UC242_57]|uniref:alpha-L-rhamnosidase C-terminal domain-containing protein n=1 Tax=Aeromicrobium sp. UC242_57 TaxID=3374624 RepID=UPI0037A3CE7B